MSTSFARRRHEPLRGPGDPKPSAKVYHCSLEVRGYELDSFGHVNHGVYVSYLEHARWKMLEEEGITIKNFNDWGMWPVIISIESHYYKPTFAGDTLDIRTQVTHHDRASFTFEQNIYRGDTHVVKAQVRSVMVDKTGRLVRRPDEINRLWERVKD